MYLIAASALTAFSLCLLLTPLVRNIFLRARIVDHPDTHRKSHRIATPRVGGIAIALAYAVTLALAFRFHPRGIALFAQHRAVFFAILPATALIFLTGLLDDLFTLAPRQKLLGQSLVAALAVALGARVPLNHGVGWLPILLSFLWLLLCTNAFNLIDGMDGLAAGIGLFASLSTAAVALLDGNLPLAVAAIPLAACSAAWWCQRRLC